MRHLSLRLLPLALLLAACAPRSAPVATAPAPAATAPAQPGTAPAPPSVAPDDTLFAVLWTQTSVEYRASALQAYATARTQLDRALADPVWTAAVEQQGQNSSSLPPAVILDADETALDNSPFQARLIVEGGAYDESRWAKWTAERAAGAVPGAVAFTQYARQRGVTVFFVTNRDAPLEANTRANLQALGFSLDDTRDTVLTRRERPEWASDKTSRRQAVARDFRILLLVGDDLGDFLPNRGSVAERDARVAQYAEWWGTKWIVLPNPMYGSWESALRAGAPAGQEAAQRRNGLRLER
jgi:acid phosphatase